MSGYLLDTHIWLWHLTGSARLPKGIRALLDESPASCRLSPISVWELGLLVRAGRFEIDGTIRGFAEAANERLPLTHAPLTHEIAVTSHELELSHRDPADRLLAATALVYDVTLLTVDTRLNALDWLDTRSV